MKDHIGSRLMGINFTNTETLTDSQIKKARVLGITNEEMITRLKRQQNIDHYTVSVIIPVYNGEKYIQRCIDSVKSQTYKDYEIIVIDDGSTDNTLDILSKIDGITILVKPNGGTASALNTGIRNTKGNWIKWLSADDMMYPDCLENLMKNAKEECINYTPYDIIDSNDNVIGHFEEPYRKDTSELWSYFYGNGSSSLIHKKIFEKCGKFDESLKHSEDYEFWLRCTQVYGVKMNLINHYGIMYRRHPEQLTNTVGGSLDNEIKEKIKSYMEKTNLS